MPEVVRRACNLCEACCGLELHVEGDKILSVRPDAEDPLSAGYACPKGIAIADVHHDPDRLRQPMRRTPSGDFEPVSWEAALAEATGRLAEARKHHGKDAVALYVGNPVVHANVSRRWPATRDTTDNRRVRPSAHAAHSR